MGVKLNKNKLEYTVNEVSCLGLLVSSNGIKWVYKQINAIMNAETSKHKKELLRFLGLITYLQKFIPNPSALTAPLMYLTHNYVEWQWTVVHDYAVTKLKCIVAKRHVKHIRT